MSRYSSTVYDERGYPIPGVTVYVNDWDVPTSTTGAPSPLTDDDLTTVLPNPLTTDEFGEFYFNSTNGVKLIEYHFANKLLYREQIILTPTGFYPGNDAALRTDLAASTGFTLVMHKSSQSGTFARGGTAWARLGGIDDDNLFNFIDPLLDDHILDRSIATPLDTYLQNALNTGRRLRAVTGLYPVATGLVGAATGCGLLGAGAGGNHDTGTVIVANSELKWIGAAGGTILKLQSSNGQYPAGNRVEGFFFNGNSGLAAIGFNPKGCRNGFFDIVGAHFTTALFKMDPDPALSEPAGCSENTIRLVGYQTNAGDGAILLQTSTPTSGGWNCSQNIFDLIAGDYRNPNPIDVGGSDSETFHRIKLFATLATSPGVRLRAGTDIYTAARNNQFHYLAIAGANVPVYAEGTSSAASPSVENRIYDLDTASNPNLPTVEAGASLWWQANKAPLGLRSYSPNTSGNSVRQEASGLIIQSGTSASITAGGSATITLPQAFPTGAIAVQVTPKNAGMTFYADCSATQLVINNTGASAAVFRWRVEGF